MTTTLIVARMTPDAAERVAGIFDESDRTALPGLVGVTRRRLFRYQGLYFHLFETDEHGPQRVEQIREHELFVDVNEKLAAHIKPFDERTWKSPRDAMAEEFYHWSV
ncbi:TcmI family type II polyketide cyclase [Amycolatopsis sp. H20-H5]|uniref:TcmI family type II polyketide cyclase n=1 Tax=Amycolatopsis sp. H20-H5 TaxID=3046309 RepID=UPI002DB61E41|nr:TcmI family type II polyketide cyclase [Amycolatopsis sp. H20-H5]MEC3974268.1 TcmI family type II polyketide cyclase [Amycolatopsis sp. H20-H5]